MCASGSPLALRRDSPRLTGKAFFSELPGAGPTLALRLLAAYGTILNSIQRSLACNATSEWHRSPKRAALGPGFIGAGTRRPLPAKLSSSGPARPLSSVPGPRLKSGDVFDQDTQLGFPRQMAAID